MFFFDRFVDNAYFLSKVNHRMTDVIYIMYCVIAADVYTQTYLAAAHTENNYH